MNSPVDLVFPPSQDNEDNTATDYVARLKKSIQISHEIARNTLKTSQDLMKRNYDLRIHENQYKKGDFVYVLDTAVVKSKNRKVSPPWKGPVIIAAVLFPYLYKVKMKCVIFTGNHDRLKPCNDRKILEWLERCKHASTMVRIFQD